MTARVLVPLAKGFEELEAVTVIDLLRRARFDVVAAGLESGPIKASRGTIILPDCDLDAVFHAAFDMIVLPGGMPGSDHLDSDRRIRELLQRMDTEGGYIAAICAAPKVLANAGLLVGKKATAYPGVLEQLPGAGVTLVPEPVVRDGKIITSRGPGTAMDFALELIEVLAGKGLRDEVEGPLQRSG